MATNEAEEASARGRVPAGRDAKGREVQDEVRVAAAQPRAQARAQPQPRTIASAPNADTSSPMNAARHACTKDAPSAAPL